MATKIKHKRSAVAGKQPIVSQLESGELAINTADGKVFLLRDDNTVQDLTQRIFDNDTQIRVNDKGDSALAEIQIDVNGFDKATITEDQIALKEDVTIENAKTLTFKELTASGTDGISLKAPNTLDAGYSLTLPSRLGTVGQILAVDGSGNLFFNDADVFGGNVIYVSSENGDDDNDGQSAPVKTVKRACQLASGLVYNPDGTVNFRRVNIKVAVGDYTEQNPIIVPDNTVIKGDGLRGCIIRPANANLDMLRVRNACYFGEFTFRDGVDANQVPLVPFDYAVAFDDPFDTSTSRVGYTNLPDTRPTITISPYIQNCSIISFLGGSGAKIDGAKVQSPNVPVYAIEAENPVIGAIPEQGKSMVANAFTMLQFGGTGWRLLNDAYAQIVSCFQIFLLNGVYCQSGGYCSITNSATNFGLYSLRSSGYSPKAFSFDRAFITSTGQSDGKQTVSIVGINRNSPVEEFVLRFREPDYKTAHDLLVLAEDQIADDVITWIDAQIAAATPSIWAGFTYDEAKCRRDTALLVDAVRWDILFNSNYRSVSAALRYHSGAFDLLPDQLDQHVAALAQAKTYTANLLTEAVAISRSNALWDEIIDIVQNGDANTVPGDAVAAAYSYPTPTGGSNNAFTAGYLNAVQQLLNNKQFLRKETTAWISDQSYQEISPFTKEFSYSFAKCQRDTGLILDAIGMDLALGTNFNSVTAGLAYTRANSAYVLTDQKTETVGAINNIKTQVLALTNVDADVTAETRVAAGIDEIIDILQNGAGQADALSFPAPSSLPTTDADDAATRLQNNRAFLQAEILAYLQIYYSNVEFNTAKCSRDVGYIVDALTYDILYGGNSATRQAAQAYYVGEASQLGLNQAIATSAAYAHLSTIVGDIVQGNAITPTTGNSETQNTTGNNATTTEATALDNLVAIIETVIDDGNLDNLPTETLPDLASLGVSSALQNARGDIVTARSTIIADTITFINTTYPQTTQYDLFKCENDIGLIVDALVYDLTYGGNLQTKIAANAYFIGSNPVYGTNKKAATLAAWGHLKTIVSQVIQETAITVSPGNLETQNTSAAAGSAAAATDAQTRIQEIIDYITNDATEDVVRVEPDISWVTGTELEAYGLLQPEAQINIAQNTTQWINEQIQANIWYGFTYDSTFCRRDTKLIVEAVAKDTWDTGNRYSRAAGLAYYRQNLRDSTEISISGQELQTIAAIEQAKTYALTYLTGVSLDVQDFAASKFDIVKTIINDPNDTPDYTEVSSEGDISNSYKANATEDTFDAGTAVNPTTNIFTIVGHGFSNGQKVIYDTDGGTPIGGLDDEQTYYIKIINEDEFTLTFDDSLEFDVNIFGVGNGTQKFLSGVIEFYVEEILSSHQTYQTLILESGAESYEFVPGRQITAATGALNNSAIVASWEPSERRLVVSIELVSVGSSTLRVQFDETSVITSDHAGTPNTSITVNEVSAKLGLGTATFSITATDGSSSLTNLPNLPEKAIWFHRPSIVNSSSHTWEYAGSGTDYNALPQNGGNTRSEYEQFEELPGRVYSSGTNELGDFKVGDFITAFNRTGNITFRNKVQVDELDALRLTLSDIAIEEISASVNLGDDELGGPSDARLPTQLAVRQFISNRLGGFVDKTVSTAAVPGAIVQLNVNGQLNADLIPATRQFTNTNTSGYQSRLVQVDDIPAIDLKAGDIATENYEQVELTLSGNITAYDGDLITQPGVVGASGYAKGDFVNSTTIIVVTAGAAWDETDDSTGDPWEVTAGSVYVNGSDSGLTINSKGAVSEIVDNWFLKSSNTSQYLVLDPDEDYVFTSAVVTNVARSSNVATITTSGAHNLVVGNIVQVAVGSDETYNKNGEVLSTPSTTTFTISNTGSDEGTKAVTDATARTIVTSADGGAQGAVTETRYGVASNLDNANLTGGSGYLPILGTQVYRDVDLTSNTGVGTGARANITVTAGQITDVDINRGGSGYAVGDLLSCNASDVGGSGSGFEIEVAAIEKRAYVNIVGGELFVASASSVDFVEDNIAVQSARDINFDDTISHNFLAGTLAGGGAVDYSSYRITIPNHGYTNGDPVTYNTLGNVAIGGLLNGRVYYVKVIDTSTIELYEGFALLNIVEFTSTPANNNHNITRYTTNITDNSIVVQNHGFTTGDAIRIVSLDDGSTANELPQVNAEPIDSGSRFFIGSVTTSSFTLHELRSDALSSINDLVTNAKDLETVGVGSARIVKNNVQVTSVVNTSSRLLANWNTLAVTNIDAENIISGVVSPSRLASAGVANTDTFLRGDSSYQVVVQKLKKSATTDNPITLTGSNIGGEYYGDPVSIGIANVDYDPLGTFSSLGTSRFLQTQFNVNVDGSGEVFIKDGVIDAGTLDSLDSAYFLNPANLTSAVPVNRGGTAITTYAVGDILYAQSTGSLNTLNIGRANNFLKSNGTTPEWGTALDLAEGLDVGSAKLSSTSTGTGSLYNENVTSLDIGGAATNIKIGNSTSTRSLLSFLEGYDATASQNVAVNLASLDADTNGAVANGETEIPMSDTSTILVGMLVTGSASIPSNTTVTGVTDLYIYISNDTTGTVTSGTTLTFTYTPFTLGVREGDTVNIAGSTITNLDGTWPVTGATSNATSFTIQTDANVTADPLSAPAGSISINNNMIIRNTTVVLGDAETSAAPTDATIKGANGYGTDVGGGELSIEGGLGTGNATGGDVVIKTGAVSTTGDIQHTSTERLRVDTSGKATFTGEIAANGGTISTNQTTANLLDTTATTINMGGAATTVEIGAATGTTTVHNNVDIDLDLNVDGGDITTNATTFNLINTNATTLNIGGAATTVNIGTGGDGGGTTTIGHDLVVTGDLTVNGNTTTINSTTLTVDDLNIVLASGAANATAANGAGITIDGANATLTYDSVNTAFDSSEDFNLASGKAYFINDASVLSSTTLGSAVVNSSLQTVGTIGTGTWQGTIISPTYGGTGINNGTKTITLGGNFTHTGAHTLGLTTTGNTSLTLPTSGTVAVSTSGLGQFASTTSAQLRGVMSDETGTGVLVFGTNPTITTGIVSGSATINLFDTTATTINFGGAATTVDIGAATGTTTIKNNLEVSGNLQIGGLSDLAVSGSTFTLANTGATVVNAFGAATDINMGAATGDFNIKNSTTTLDGNLYVNGNTLDTDETGTFNLLKDNATNIAFAQAARQMTIGETKAAAVLAGQVNPEVIVRLDLRTNADMYVDGTLYISSLNNTPIGNVTPSSGAFTTLAANDLVTFTASDNATGATWAASAAAVKITGGLWVQKDIRADNFIGDMDASYLTSGTLPDARIAVTGVTQHQASITGTGALNSGSITSGFGNINIGSSIFTGDGSGLSALNASNLSSGTVPDGRIAASSITQHQASITGTGALDSGSITSNFGDINIGTSTFTGNGSGLTSLSASNLSTGTVAGGRLGGNQTMAGIKTFSDTTEATTTANGAIRLSGGLSVAKNIVFGGTATGNGSGLTSLDASNLSQGTVPSARVSGSYTGITGTGALDAGQITSNFGDINIGTSIFTGDGSGLTSVDAATLDTLDSTQFLRSDAADTMTGILTISRGGDEHLALDHTSASGNPYIQLRQAGTNRALIMYQDFGDMLKILNYTHSTGINIQSGNNGLQFANGANTYTMWHSGNDGDASGLDADKLDGVEGSSFLRSDANDSFSGTLSGGGSINITGDITAANFTGNGSGLTGISADDANTLDGIDSTGFLQSSTTASQNHYIRNASPTIYLRDTDHNVSMIHQNSNIFYILRGATDSTTWTQVTGTSRWPLQIDVSTNDMTTGGSINARTEITAYGSDERLKENIRPIENALDKIKQLDGVFYDWKDMVEEVGFFPKRRKDEAGVLAQQVEKVLPQAVALAPFDADWTRNPDGSTDGTGDQYSVSGENYLTVKYEKLAPLFIEAIKEQDKIIQDQQKQIDELKELVKKLLDK